MISYFDIRAARTAMRALQNKPLRRRKLDIHFSIPKVLLHLLLLMIYTITLYAIYFFCFLTNLLSLPCYSSLCPSMYNIYQDNPSDKDVNQGTLVVFNLDPSVSNDDLRHIFGVYGEIKEVRDSISQTIYFPFYSIYSFALVCFLKELVYVKIHMTSHFLALQIRETPHKRHHKFIEYYDVRAAEAALRTLNRSDIAGKRIKLEPSRPGGARRK